ncbi:mitochondrial thiamine pyrophosphate transporter [Physocladia obscura]|uniref:Mitochondrial thiamine pyrophosphate transporter n=1 Tax=Physocladia obscura TaxID=109957 RepID=A0AAD5T060_9FUNG|nr:mitochondrial thiamine pyrophosphate transporter [Physocladia obscura]
MRNKTEDKPELTKAQNAASGATAGVIARLVIAPLDVVKIRFQIQTSVRSQHNQPKYRGIIQSMTTIAKEEGIRGLWKGNWPAEYLYLTYGAVQFLAYHESLKLYPETMPLSGKVFVAGAIAGTTATVVTYPLDLLRTRFAMQGTHKVYSGIVNACLQIAKTEGVRGFYRGVWTSLLQIAPYMGIMFGIQDILVEKLKRIEPGYWPHGWDQFASGAAAGIISKTAVMPFDVVRYENNA